MEKWVGVEVGVFYQAKTTQLVYLKMFMNIE